MILAVNIFISFSSANSYASVVTLTSKAKIEAYSLWWPSPTNDFEAFSTSFLWTGPILIAQTGIFIVFRNSRRASRDPIVDA